MKKLMMAIAMMIVMMMACNVNVNAKSKIVSRKEVITGVVKNNKKDGRVLTDKEIIKYANGKVKVIHWKVSKKFDYISYKGIKCRKGNIIKTVCTMNPNNREPDDILKRKDKVIKRKGR